MAVELAGREEELGFLNAFLDRRAEGPAALVLEGEAGIGKSALWLAGVQAATDRGFRVLSTRPAEADRELAHVGLGDLLEDVLEDVLPALATPRRRALEVALLVGESAERSPDPRALGVAVRTALRLLAEEGPLVVAVDDVQWLDPSSAHALAFALRRLHDAGVLVLMTRRVGEGTQLSLVVDALDVDRLERLPVGPLSLGAVQRVVQVRLGQTLARPTLLRLHETSGGNPLYALELARAFVAHGAIGDPTQPLPVPQTLEGLVRARLDRLPDATRGGLALVAALGRPSLALLSLASVEELVLEPALDARVIEVADGVISFSHPLLASVLYQGLSASEQRRTHALAAEVVDDPVRRARHVALASAGPDAEVADVLEHAAKLATGRGAIVAAAELCEYALRFTPAGADEDAQRRLIAATRAHLAAGEVERARSLARDLVARTPGGAGRAEALELLSELQLTGDLQEAVALLQEALQEPAAPLALRASIHRRLSLEVRFTEGMQAAEKHARTALELAECEGDDVLRSGAMAALALVRFNAGGAEALELAEQAYAPAIGAADPQHGVDAGFCLAHILVWSAHIERARELLENLYRTWSARDERFVADALWYLSLVELQAGRWPAAAELAGRARELSVLYGRDETEAPQNLFPIALVAAYQGDIERAGDVVERAEGLAGRQGALLPALAGTRGLVELWRGEAAAAVGSFGAAEDMAHSAEWGEPALYSWRADYVEALLELGRIDAAATVLDAWQADAARLTRDRVLAQATRCRGLISAARGDVDDARAILEQAVEQHEAVGDPFGRARALLALGIVRRRARQKRGAREAIEAALAGFEALGAAGWAAKARAELGRIAGRRRETGLTAAERRVAELVAEGRTNREVAAALFLGERTVETHLTHVYAKLGVRSRTELARKLP